MWTIIVDPRLVHGSDRFDTHNINLLEMYVCRWTVCLALKTVSPRWRKYDSFFIKLTTDYNVEFVKNVIAEFDYFLIFLWYCKYDEDDKLYVGDEILLDMFWNKVLKQVVYMSINGM